MAWSAADPPPEAPYDILISAQPWRALVIGSINYDLYEV
jgi:hypothetical protein